MCLEEDALFGRYGGDEFAIIMPKKTSEEAIAIAKKIQASTQLNINYSLPTNYTLSMGLISLIPTEKTKLETLYMKCDQALYQAKNEGKNKIIVADIDKR